jgi:GT2 family glycosyltransferase
MSGPTTSVSIVIVNWNSGDMLARCLSSLRDAPLKIPLEVVVVDNASLDGSLDAALGELPGVRTIRNTGNVGLAPGNNQGIAIATGDAILLSNPDIEYRPGAIDAMVEVLDRRPRAAFVVPKVEHDDGSIQTSAGDLPSAVEAIFGRNWSQRQARSPEDGGMWWDGWAHDEERRIGHGAECAYLVRRAAIDEIGLQDERFVLDWEGLDWAARAGDAGWELWFTPASVVVHHGGVSIRQARTRWIMRTHLGMTRYLRKRQPVLGTALVPVIVLRAGVKMIANWCGVPFYDLMQRARPNKPSTPEDGSASTD